MRSSRLAGRKGFSLVEVLVATAIGSILLASLALSFQVGLKAHERSERSLSENRDGDLFVRQLTSELRSAIPLSLAPFEGKADRLRFPARLRSYSARGVEEGIYEVEYRFREGRLERRQKPLKRRLSDRTAAGEEVLFDHLKKHGFEYLFVREDGSTQWRDSWPSGSRSEVPRGVRVVLEPDPAQGRFLEREIVIPQGVLRSVT